MAYSGHKKEDLEDTSMERHWKSARPAKPWNPFGQLPAPQRGGGEEEESCASNNGLNVVCRFVSLKTEGQNNERKVCV